MMSDWANATANERCAESSSIIALLYHDILSHVVLCISYICLKKYLNRCKDTKNLANTIFNHIKNVIRLCFATFLSFTQPQAEECADAPFDVMQGEALLVAGVGEIEYHRHAKELIAPVTRKASVTRLI